MPLTYSTLLALVTVALIATSTPSHASPVNLLQLGDFECTKSEFDRVWSIPYGQTAALDSGVFASGKQSLRIECPDGGADVNVVQTADVDCSHASRLLEVSAKVKLENVRDGGISFRSCRCYVQFLDREDKAIKTEEAAPSMTGTQDWRTISRCMLAPMGTTKVRVNLTMARCFGTAWFDDVRVVDRTEILDAREDAKATVVVREHRTVGKMSLGLGWNWCTHATQFVERQVALLPQLCKMATYAGDDWVRLGVAPAFFPPDGKGGYNFDTPHMRGISSMLAFFERNNTHVLLCPFWARGEAGVPGSGWLAEATYRPELIGKEAGDMPHDDAEFARALAAMVKHLRVDKGFTCVKQISIWNEARYQWILADPLAYPKRYFAIYDALSANMRKLGVRGMVDILGAESVEGGDVAVISAGDVVKYGKSVDICAVHDYASGTEAPSRFTSEGESIRQSSGYAKAISVLRSGGRPNMPVAATELGAYGTDPITDPGYQYQITLGISEYAIRCLNAGVAGLLRWQFSEPDPNQFAACSEIDGKLTVKKTIYWGWTVLTRWTVRGSAVLGTDVLGGKDSAGFARVSATALKSPQGWLSVLMVNSGSQPKKLTIRGLKPGKHAWNHFYYDATLPEGILQGKCSAKGSDITLELPVQSVNVLTNCSVALTGPAPGIRANTPALGDMSK